MTSDEMRRPPVTVVAAVVLLVLLAAALVVMAVVAFVMKGDTFALLYVLPAILPAGAALGVWRGNRGARALAVLVGVLNLTTAHGRGDLGMPGLAAGVLIVALLLAPGSSRGWFAPRAVAP